MPYTLSFKVTGLDEASRYNYVLSVLDQEDKPIHVYIGAFATKCYPGMMQEGGDEVIPTPPIIPSDPEAQGITTDLHSADCEPSSAENGIIMLNNKIMIVKDGRIYTLQGQEIRQK